MALSALLPAELFCTSMLKAQTARWISISSTANAAGAAIEGITKGEWRPWPDEEKPVSLLIDRPNIFVLYEQNIGALTPIIADELRDAEQTYPPQWIEEAIKIAVENNVRRWRYVRHNSRTMAPGRKTKTRWNQ